jgi:hypothetical protein
VFEPPHHRQPPLPRRILRGESRFAAHGNRLLQQNRHFSDIRNESSVRLLCGVKRTFPDQVFDFRIHLVDAYAHARREAFVADPIGMRFEPLKT